MSTTCPHCGHLLDGGEPAVPRERGFDRPYDSDEPVPDIGTGPGVSTGLAAPPVSPITPAGPPKLRPSWLPWVLGLVALVAVALAATSLFGSESASVPDTPADDPASAPESDANVDSAPRRGDPNFPPSDSHMAADSIADLFRSVVDDDARWAAIYPSPLGLQVLSASGAAEPSIEVAVGFEEAARFPLISDGSTSWAIDPSRLDTAYLVSTQFVVIDIDREGRVGFINDSLDPPNIGESSFGAWGPGFDLPADAKVLPVPGRALFVLPATGGTYEYDVNGVTQYSDDVLVAASQRSDILQRCDDQLACELYAVTQSHPEGLRLDFDLRSDFWISPGGNMLVVQEPDGLAQIVWLDADGGVILDGPIRAVDWSDDETRAAILTDTQLSILMPEGLLVSVTLPIEPSGSAVLLVRSDS